jgi:Asp-tRNA(Asn)/Glu-tRNA(Gln) amidotransferase C subunit
MAHLSVEEQHIKDLLKQAILELLEERQDIFRQLVVEAMEDLALINAIKEGEATETVSREEILQILEGVA